MAGRVGIYPGGPSPVGLRHPRANTPKQRFAGATTVEPIAGNAAANPMDRVRRQKQILGVIIAVLCAAMTGLWLGSTPLHRVSPGPALDMGSTTPDPPSVHARR